MDLTNRYLSRDTERSAAATHGMILYTAAIVARELGIPAMVICENAATHPKIGDRVRVDGGRGIVEIAEKSSGESLK